MKSLYTFRGSKMPKNEVKSIHSFFFILFCLSSFIANATTRYVKPTATGTGDGSSWANASANLQAMIDAAAANDEVWVMAGTYKPSANPTSCVGCSSTRDYGFLLKNQVKIYGSFVGTETLLSQRTATVISTNPTILSGDIGTIGVTTDNVYHVILSLNDDNTTVFDGFTITKGNADGSGSTTIETFDVARYQGGGMYNGYSSSSIFNNCNFISNNSSFEGGGMLIQNNLSAFTNCNFSGNTASKGGAIMGTHASPTMTNCTFSNNVASAAGGIYNYDGSSPIYINCSFSNNTATGSAGAIYNLDFFVWGQSNPTIKNCIFWGNKIGAAVSSIEGNTATVSYSDVEGGYAGATNINQNPLFVNATDPDGADNIFSTTDDGLALESASPTINASDPTITTPTKDITGFTRIGVFDMGAYEFNLCIIYVNDNAAGNNNGTSWANAYTSLESALSAARSLNCPSIQIWVAAGTYKPSAYAQNITIDGFTPPLSNRDFTFDIVNGVKMYGSFLGTETSLSQRTNAVIAANPSILSGDIGVPNDIIDNSYHVVLSISNNNTTIFDGFTITKGNANGDYFFNIALIQFPQYYGGGMTLLSSSPTITNCIFTGNTSQNGGGLSIDSSSPIISNCSFYANNSNQLGGGLINISDASPIISNCSFSSNTARGGGGICNAFCSFSTINITNCSFSANNVIVQEFFDGGGGIMNLDSSPIITNCSFFGNNSSGSGGGIFNYNLTSNTVIKNSIFSGNLKGGNSVLAGADIQNEGTALISYSALQLANNITNYPVSITLGTGNIFDTNPLFVNVADPDGADNIFGTADDGLALQNCSPAINSGNNADNLTVTDITGAARISNTTIDMGAYERANGIAAVAILYVKANATGGNNGSNWANAYVNLQDALAYTCTNNEIWVAAGTYKPTAYPISCTNCSSSRDYAFLLKNQAKLYGSFAGTETSLSQRTTAVITANPSILSGDIGTLNVTTDNVYHVIISLSDDNTTILDGFTITKGNANGNGSTTIETFDVARIQGGGMYNGYYSSSIFNNCNFIANNSSFEGGGMLIQHNLSSFTNCNFSGNTSNRGGAVFGTHASPIYTNCTFSNNIATSAGAMYNWDGSSPTLTNCSFSNNSANNASGGVYNLGNNEYGDSNPTVKNGVFWGNRRATTTVSSIDGSAATVSYTDVEGGYAGANNINQDPLFVNANDPDGTDNVFATTDDGLALQSTSPIINLGDPASFSPIKDITDFVRTIPFDMGAYEYRTCSNNVILFSTVYDYSAGTFLNTASSAVGKITATNKITGTARATYNAKSIELNAGFKADSGAVFLAMVGGCN